MKGESPRRLDIELYEETNEKDSWGPPTRRFRVNTRGSRLSARFGKWLRSCAVRTNDAFGQPKPLDAVSIQTRTSALPINELLRLPDLCVTEWPKKWADAPDHRLASSACSGAELRTTGCGASPFNISHRMRLYTWSSTRSGALRSNPSDMRAAGVFCGFFSFKSCLGVIASKGVSSGVEAKISASERLK